MEAAARAPAARAPAARAPAARACKAPLAFGLRQRSTTLWRSREGGSHATAAARRRPPPPAAAHRARVAYLTRVVLSDWFSPIGLWACCLAGALAPPLGARQHPARAARGVPRAARAGRRRRARDRSPRWERRPAELERGARGAVQPRGRRRGLVVDRRDHQVHSWTCNIVDRCGHRFSRHKKTPHTPPSPSAHPSPPLFLSHPCVPRLLFLSHEPPRPIGHAFGSSHNKIQSQQASDITRTRRSRCGRTS